MMLPDLAVKATLLLIVAIGIARLMRRASAASRHALWTATFCAVLLLPIATLTLPSLPLMALPARAETPLPPPSPNSTSAEVRTISDLIVGQRRVLTGPRTDLNAAVSRDALFSATWVPNDILVIVWLTGVATLMIRGAAGIIGISRLARRLLPTDDDRLLSGVRSAGADLGLARPVVTLMAAGNCMPATWGFLQPRLLLPYSAVSWSDERLRAVLVHELAHVARRDALSQAIANLAVALLWFNPLIWSAARRARLERERACDDQVLNTGALPSGYAAELLAMVHSLSAPTAGALAMVRRSQLERRLSAILDTRVNRRGVSRAGLTVASGLVILTLPVAAARPTTRVIDAKVVTPAHNEVALQAAISVPDPIASFTRSLERAPQPFQTVQPQVETTPRPEAPPTDFSGTWVPDDPKMVRELFAVGLSNIPGGGITIAQEAKTLTVTRLVTSEELAALTAISNGSFEVTTVYNLDGSDSRHSRDQDERISNATWRGHKLVIRTRNAITDLGETTYAIVGIGGGPFTVAPGHNGVTKSLTLNNARAIYSAIAAPVISYGVQDGRLRIDGVRSLFFHRKSATMPTSVSFAGTWVGDVERNMEAIRAGIWTLRDNNPMVIQQDTATLTITRPVANLTTVFHLDGSASTNSSLYYAPRTSTAGWEGDTIVVDTTNPAGTNRTVWSLENGCIKLSLTDYMNDGRVVVPPSIFFKPS